MSVRVNGALQGVTLETGDVEIGAVEIKDGETDNRAQVEAANAVAAATDNVLKVQPLAADGTKTVPGTNAAGSQVDGHSASLGATTDAEATANGGVIGLLKRLRTLLAGGLPSALSADRLKVESTGSGTFNVNPSGETAGVGVGAAADAEAAANGSAIGLLKRLRTLLAGGLPAALSAGGNLKVQIAESGTSTPVSVAPVTSGGLATHRRISTATTNAQSIKASAGQVYAVMASNLNAAARYLKLYNNASAPTVGTDVPVDTILIPPNSSGVVLSVPAGVEFTTGIASALTTGVADADATAVAADDVVFHVYFK